MSVCPFEGLNLIIDASVGVKWLVPEVHSVEASFLMSPEIRRHIPVHFYTEVSQAVWKKVHIRNELSVEEGRETFRRLLLLPLTVHSIEPLIELSFEIALRTGRTVYDSVYLALARSKGWQFVTADERLYNALQGSEFEQFLIWISDIPSILPKPETEEVEESADDEEITDLTSDRSVEKS